MTRRSLIASGAVLAAHRALRAADAEMRLSFSLPKKQYRAGEPIPLTWTLENVSPRPLAVIAWEEAGGGREFSGLSLQVSVGGAPPRPAPTSFPSSAARPVWRKIASGDILEQQLDLSRSLALMAQKPGPGLYHLTGEYTLRATTSPDGDVAWNGRTAPATIDFEILA